MRCIVASHMKRDVRLTIDEGDVIVQIASAMQRDGPTLWENIRTVAALQYVYSSPRKWPRLLPFLRRISRDDLAFLAPYIDDWVAGKAPPQGLPPEYYDCRPDTLRSFKDRMVSSMVGPADYPARWRI
jgi:hypothetical protein